MGHSLNVGRWTALDSTLQEAGRSSSAGKRDTRFRSSLVVAELALAIVLLTGGGLLIRSFSQIL